MPSNFRFAGTDQRQIVIGRTGSGKTVMGAFLLSNAPFHKMPYVIIDYKGDDLLNSIERARYITFKDKPKEPGIYILRATPVIDDNRVESFLWGVHARGKTGLFYDEGYMIPDIAAMNAIYTQGRSKHIPVTTLTQRPVQLTRFAFSESEFVFCYKLNDRRDEKTVLEMVPRQDEIWNFDVALPPFRCRWHDVPKDVSEILLPCPSPDDILDQFDFRLRPQRKIYR